MFLGIEQRTDVRSAPLWGQEMSERQRGKHTEVLVYPKRPGSISLLLVVRGYCSLLNLKW